MSKHRSLSNALLTPERLAFIKGDKPTEDGKLDVMPAEASAPQTEAEPGNAVATNRDQVPANNDYLVAVTTRLQARTADALRRAYLEQKLNRREPATQQEIIEAALQTWLRTHAYL